MSDEVLGFFLLLCGRIGSAAGVMEQARDEALDEDGDDIMADV
jgi:hypothetical protein